MKDFVVKVSGTPKKVIITYFIEKLTSISCSPTGNIRKVKEK